MADLNIIYQDTAIVVVNKPAGLLSVPGRRPEHQDCVANRIRNQFPRCIPQPSVHRLDMDTSGLMVLALTVETHRNLSIQFQERKVSKQYVAVLDGAIEKDKGTIELPFRLDVDNRPYQIYDPVYGKVGITRWEKIGVEGNRTRILFTPVTGRTHQLRIHAAHPLGLGCPIMGDRLYGINTADERLLLHASRLTFLHPVTDEGLEFENRADF